MKIKTYHPANANFAKVLDCFRAAADERGIPHEDAQISAMLLWVITYLANQL